MLRLLTHNDKGTLARTDNLETLYACLYQPTTIRLFKKTFETTNKTMGFTDIIYFQKVKVNYIGETKQDSRAIQYTSEVVNDTVLKYINHL